MKKIIALILALALSIALVACSAGNAGNNTANNTGNNTTNNTGDSGDKTTADGKLAPEDQTYCWVAAGLNVSYYQHPKMGLAAVEDFLGVNVEIMGPTESDVNLQCDAIEQAIAMNPQGIVVHSYGSETTSLINKAMDQGIPVVCSDSDNSGSNRYLCCGTGNYAAGKTGGEYLVKTLGEEFTCVLLTTPTAENITDRIQGYKDVFANYPGITVLPDALSNADVETAAASTAAVIQANPDLDLVICVDGAAPTGAATAIAEAGKTGEIMLMAMDRDAEILQKIKEGSVTATLVQNSALMPFYAILSLYVDYNYSDDLGFSHDAGMNAFFESMDTGCYIADKSNVDVLLAELQ